MAESEKTLILIADDDEGIRQWLRMLLVRKGFEVQEATSADAAWQVARDCVPDLFLLDVDMPPGDGFTLCRRLRADSQTHAQPILMLSGRVQANDRVKGLEAGADDFLVKPCDQDELLTRIEVLFRRFPPRNRFFDRVQLARRSIEAAESYRRFIVVLNVDVCGSSKPRTTSGDEYQRALVYQEYHALVERLVTEHGGSPVAWAGDGGTAEFAESTAALSAALAIVRARTGHDRVSELELRLGVAAGTELIAPNQEIGMRTSDTHNRAGHLQKAASPNSLMVGSEIAAALADSFQFRLAAEVGGQNAFTVGIESATHPEIVGPGTEPGDSVVPAPALVSVEEAATPRMRSNLPAQISSLIGRERELAELRNLLDAPSTRLLTITGSGGCGKTRLALQLASEVKDGFRHGACLVDLSALTDPGLVAQAVADAVMVREEPNRPITASLTEHLRDQQRLLVLDNCEHLIATCAQVCELLLTGSRELRILATSREPLHVPGEVAWRVPGLQVPLPQDDLQIDQLTQYAAVQLFIERAQAVNPRFVVTAESAPAIAQICWRLDGIPLAIELAAARANVLSPRQIMERLDDRFRLLSGGSRTALPRQKTLRALVDWSYDQLASDEQSLLRRVSVFAGGWTLEAAEQVSSGEGIEEVAVLDLLTRLVDKSMVTVEDQHGSMRYRTMETIRQYAHDRRLEKEEVLPQHKHLDWACTLAEHAQTELPYAQQTEWMSRLEAERENLRVALEYAIQHETEVALQLAGALGRFWETAGYFSEGFDTLRRALAAAPSAPSRERARAQRWIGMLAFRQGSFEVATRFQNESLAVSQQLGDRPEAAAALNALGGIAFERGDYMAAKRSYLESLARVEAPADSLVAAQAHNGLGNVAWASGDYDAARQHFQQSLAASQRLSSRAGVAQTLNNLGNVAWALGDFEESRNCFRSCLDLNRELGSKRGVAIALLNLGDVAWAVGEHEIARVYQQGALAVSRMIGDRKIMSYALRGLGDVAYSQQDYTAARRFYLESLTIRNAIGYRAGLAECLEEIGRVERAEQRPTRAVRLFAAAGALRQRVGVPIPAAQREAHERHLAELHDTLAGDYTQAWEQGLALSLEEAVAYAQQVMP